MRECLHTNYRPATLGALGTDGLNCARGSAQGKVHLSKSAKMLEVGRLAFRGSSMKRVCMRTFAGTLEDRGQQCQPVSEKRNDVYDGRVGRASKRLCIFVDDHFLRRGKPEAQFRNFIDVVDNSMTTTLEDDENVPFGFNARYPSCVGMQELVVVELEQRKLRRGSVARPTLPPSFLSRSSIL